MASVYGFIRRNWAIRNPPVVPKNENALKFGVFGAANITQSHPDVIVQCVAARSEKKAQEYAKKHGIPEVKKSYQDILDDPSISCVYIPLPNGLHYEWALRSLAAGKHVLLEKPSVSNATEAKALFFSPLLEETSDVTCTKLVLLEAFHFRFQPPWRAFMGHVDSENVERARATLAAPRVMFEKNDIRFQYALSGGCAMDPGTYPVACLRQVFGATTDTEGVVEDREPEECLSADLKMFPEPEGKTDSAFEAKFRFPGGGIGEVRSNLLTGMLEMEIPRVEVVHRPVVLSAEEAAAKVGGKKGKGKGLGDDEELVRTRKVVIENYLVGAVWHRIIVEDDFLLRKRGGESKEPIRKWTNKKVVKAYTWEEGKVEAMEGQPGEAHWLTYRHQLEQFVNRVRGTKGNGLWIDAKDSVNQSKAIDMVYEKAGVPLRPTSEFQL
ncbi:hypothetical protein MKZ38_001473 [Zalerion maritima]|uniref:D-xylose 1-dehydrogenase (NADP(+), D-xylono-1,5-lactone-forming) n=1 Tax=Zalerion maritima TaxID=339359 RepID=A0AAD5RZN0_9PEZI|nr:hypothetical protein MKZ38_001473 [Zalerion maritima]